MLVVVERIACMQTPFSIVVADVFELGIRRLKLRRFLFRDTMSGIQARKEGRKVNIAANAADWPGLQRIASPSLWPIVPIHHVFCSR